MHAEHYIKSLPSLNDDLEVNSLAAHTHNIHPESSPSAKHQTTQEALHNTGSIKTTFLSLAGRAFWRSALECGVSFMDLLLEIRQFLKNQSRFRFIWEYIDRNNDEGTGRLTYQKQGYC